MAINRELSQFANFLNVNDSNQTIGIATTATPYVGFGTTNPSTKVEVVGGLTADYFYGDGSNLTGIATGLTATVGVQSGGTPIGTGITTLNVVGTGFTADTSGTTANLYLPAPGVSLGLAIALGG